MLSKRVSLLRFETESSEKIPLENVLMSRAKHRCTYIRRPGGESVTTANATKQYSRVKGVRSQHPLPVCTSRPKSSRPYKRVAPG